jgi:hypothetical protein
VDLPRWARIMGLIKAPGHWFLTSGDRVRRDCQILICAVLDREDYDRVTHRVEVEVGKFDRDCVITGWRK